MNGLSQYITHCEVFSPISCVPFRYESLVAVSHAKDFSESTTNILRVIPTAHQLGVKFSKSSPYTITAQLADENGKATNTTVALKFFAGKAAWWNKLFPLYTPVVISGKPKFYKEEITFTHPKKIPDSEALFVKSSGITPVYKKYGIKIDDKTIQENLILKIKDVGQISQHTEEKINFHLGLTQKLTIHSALLQIHKPSSTDALDEAMKFLSALEYTSYKNTLQKINNHSATALKFDDFQIIKYFPHKLTQSQIEAISQISKFQKSQSGKLFLLQGDVGCGKTIIAISTAINTVHAGFQVAVLAPTQILAIQLYHNFNEILSKLNITCTLLTGKDKAKERREKLAGIASGMISVVVGTHAVFSANVEFQNLGFVIIDEQHKFGVNQRLELMRKSQNAKCLLMTATPIPRTLAMSMYSGIEYFSVKEKPQNRLPIHTAVLSSNKAGEILASAKKRFGNDFKMYWVCPFIDAEIEGKSNIVEREKFLLKYFKQEEIITVHGKMKEPAINDAILQFKENPDIRILLSTTIVEVGIDIPKANIIVIESSQNFGLASLHQLRGRVGRNSMQSYCILLFDGELSQNATTRLQAMKESNDGFYISEVDRKVRGSGNILGEQQSGAMRFSFFDEEVHQGNILQLEDIFLSIPKEEREVISEIFSISTSLEFSHG